MNDTDPNHKLSAKSRKIIGIISIAMVLVLFGLLAWFVGRPLIRYISQPEQFRLWVDAHGFVGRLAFVGMMVIQIIIAIIPGEVFELSAGYAFGFWEGSLLCMIGIIIGNIIVFGLVRKFGIKVLEAFFSLEKIRSLKFLQNTKRLNLLVFIINFIPGTPKDLISYAVGLTPIRLRDWIIITATARIPSIITSTMAGSALGDANYMFAIIVYAITLAISGAGILIYRHITKQQKIEEDIILSKDLPENDDPKQ